MHVAGVEMVLFLPRAELSGSGTDGPPERVSTEQMKRGDEKKGRGVAGDRVGPVKRERKNPEPDQLTSSDEIIPLLS